MATARPQYKRDAENDYLEDRVPDGARWSRQRTQQARIGSRGRRGRVKRFRRGGEPGLSLRRPVRFSLPRMGARAAPRLGETFVQGLR
jgi:hypothetical protein